MYTLYCLVCIKYLDGLHIEMNELYNYPVFLDCYEEKKNPNHF